MRIKNNRGFTLIEILAVIVILGVLLAIAVPSVSKYILQSRRKSIVTSISTYISSATTDVDSLEYEFKNDNVIYALPVECISVSAKRENIFKKIEKSNGANWAYVLIQYDSASKSYIYGFTFSEIGSYGMYPITFNNMSRKGNDIETNLDIGQPTNGLCYNFTAEENWSNSGFTLNSSTTLNVLEAVENGDGKDTCTLVG